MANVIDADVVLGLTFAEAEVLESLLYSVESDNSAINLLVARTHNALAEYGSFSAEGRYVLPAEGDSLNVVAGRHFYFDTAAEVGNE